MEYRDYPYQSILAPYIRNFLEEKRGLGFIYNGMAYQLFRLDQYWSLHGYQSMDMSPERLDDWIKALPSEGKSSQRGRICAIRSFGSYLIALGLNSYSPLVGIGGDHPVVHILTKDELRQLFEVIDSYIPKTRCKADLRMANEYPLIFRLLYCCGMRNNEVCSLKMSAIDFNAGIIELQDTKNQKDRLVYCPADLLKLLQQYHHWIIWTTGYEPYWLFPTDGGNSIILTAGNHEAFKTKAPYVSATEQETYNAVFSGRISGWNVTQPQNASEDGLGYFYKDYATPKLRVIYADPTHGTEYIEAETTWFESVLLDAHTNGYSVMCVEHYPFKVNTYD